MLKVGLIYIFDFPPPEWTGSERARRYQTGAELTAVGGMGESLSVEAAPPVKVAAVADPAGAAVQGRVRARDGRASPPRARHFPSLPWKH